MNPARQTTTKPQLALQSYLDGLLQDATEELDAPQAPAEEAIVDEFAAAVREEQARDAERQAAPAAVVVVPVFLVVLQRVRLVRAVLLQRVLLTLVALLQRVRLVGPVLL